MTETHAQPIRTTCPYCGVGCGVLAERGVDGTVTVLGDPEHPANRGRLCSKGAALGDTVNLDGRLLQPMVDGARTDWDTALDRVAGGLQRIIAEHGPAAVAFYGSGQMLTEDYYVANKLFKGFVGTAHLDTNSRLCMASAVAGHKRAFGSDTVPGNYEDLEQAELLVLAGSNLAWCHPVLYQRIVAARESNPDMRVVVIDPRRTDTCNIADLHLPLAPGTDAWLWNGLLHHLARDGVVDYAFLEAHTEGFGRAIEQARTGGSVPEVAGQCDLPEGDVMQFYRLFARTERTVSLFSQGVNQSTSGSDKVNSIINCHLLTGRIGRPGAGPLSITGQPNAMGGREVGALANQLAAHMDFEPGDVDRVRRFWDAPRLVAEPGHKAVDLYQAIERGEIRAVWIMATNPAVSLPDADRMREVLRGCELVVVSEAMAGTDTTAAADVLLPALTWGEKDGTVTNSERRISRQRPFLPAPGEAKPGWWALCRVAERLGYGDAFPYRYPQEIFDEQARLSTFENDGSRDFDIGGLAGPATIRCRPGSGRCVVTVPTSPSLRPGPPGTDSCCCVMRWTRIRIAPGGHSPAVWSSYATSSPAANRPMRCRPWPDGGSATATTGWNSATPPAAATGPRALKAGSSWAARSWDPWIPCRGATGSPPCSPGNACLPASA